MKISRKELYDLVWSETMTSISKRFGISIDGLRKHCKSMNIPTPPNGYWTTENQRVTIKFVALFVSVQTLYKQVWLKSEKAAIIQILPQPSILFKFQ